MKATDWVLIIGAVAQAVGLIITAIKASGAKAAAVEAVRQVTPPSNGHTLGNLVESSVVASHSAAVDAGRVRQSLLPQAPPPEPLPHLPEGPYNAPD